MGTLTEIRDIVRHRLFADKDFTDGVATGGSTSTLVDTVLMTDIVGAPHYVGAYVYVVTSTTGPAGEEVRVSQFDKATGTLTIAPAFTVTAVADDIYELYYDGLTVKRFNEAINEALRVGTRDAVADLATDVAAQAALSDDTVAQGALHLLFRVLARKRKGDEKGEALAASHQHLVNFRHGVKDQGYGEVWQELEAQE